MIVLPMFLKFVKDRKQVSYTSPRLFDEYGLPRNPTGRTGIEGRVIGVLLKYGSNYAADPIVTRMSPETGALQCLLCRVGGGKGPAPEQYTLPSGMVECSGVDVTSELAELFNSNYRKEIEAFFDTGGELVYEGYMNDCRATDGAWMETRSAHFHLIPEYTRFIKDLEPGGKKQWVDLPPSVPIYSEHRAYIDTVYAKYVTAVTATGPEPEGSKKRPHTSLTTTE